MIGILPNLTKDYILNQISEEDIFCKFTNLSATDIRNCVDSSDLIKSPIRTDHLPTVGFYHTPKGNLKMRDFNGYFWGDCFDLVAFHYNLKCNNGQDFAIVLDKIAKAFGIHKYSAELDIEINTYRVSDSIKPKVKLIFKPEFRNWLKVDADYWKYLNRKDLEDAKIFPLNSLSINEQIVYTYYGDRDVAYIYIFGDNKYKIYYPYRTKSKTNRFLSNTSVVQGANKIEPNQFGIVTKSYKDVVYLRKFGINAIAPSSESVVITPSQAIHIKTMWDYTFSLMDYDNTGIRNAIEHQRRYNIHPLFLTDKLWNRRKGFQGAKDFSDYVILKGINKTGELIDQIINKLNNQYNIDLVWNNPMK